MRDQKSNHLLGFTRGLYELTSTLNFTGNLRDEDDSTWNRTTRVIREHAGPPRPIGHERRGMAYSIEGRGFDAPSAIYIVLMKQTIEMRLRHVGRHPVVAFTERQMLVARHALVEGHGC